MTTNPTPLTAEPTLNKAPYYLYGVLYEDNGEPCGREFMGISKTLAIALQKCVLEGEDKHRGAIVMEWRMTNEI